MRTPRVPSCDGLGPLAALDELAAPVKGLRLSVSVSSSGSMSGDRPAVIREQIRTDFAPLNAPVHVGFDDWFGADVALATGWQTVFPVLQLDATRARAYFVQDHEPEFYGGGTEHRWAQETYTKGLHAICASPWLADLVREPSTLASEKLRLRVGRRPARAMGRFCRLEASSARAAW